MTVADLIAELATMPQDAIVALATMNGGDPTAREVTALRRTRRCSLIDISDCIDGEDIVVLWPMTAPWGGG